MAKKQTLVWALVALGLMLVAALARSQDAKTVPEGQEAKGAAEPAEAGDDLGDAPPARQKGKEKVPPSPLTPRPDEMPKTDVGPAPEKYDTLLSDIAALRGRVSALTTTLFQSKLRIIVETAGDDAQIGSLVVTLDDGVVFNGEKGFVADDERVVYEHAVAPGHHRVGVEVERTDLRGKEYTSWQASKFSVIVPDNQTLEAHLSLEDSSDMAVDFPEDQDGEYSLSVLLRARVAEE